MTLMDNTSLPPPSPPHSTSSSPSKLPQKRSNHFDISEHINHKKQATHKTRIYSNYTQACLLLHAIEINRRKMLHPRCIAHLANFVAKAWETNPDEIKTQQLYQLMQNLLLTTAIKQPTLEGALVTFCKNIASTPTPCSSVTLLIAVSYIEKLKKKYSMIKGTVGCGSRLITIAYLIAAKFLHTNLKLIIHVPNSPPSPPTSPTLLSNSINHPPSLHLSMNNIDNINTTDNNINNIINNNDDNNNNSTNNNNDTNNNNTNNDDIDNNSNDDKSINPSTTLTSSLPDSLSAACNIPTTLSHDNILNIEPLSSSSSSSSSTSSSTTILNQQNLTLNEYHQRILRLEMEFLYFMDYDLSLPDPAKLVRWANTFDTTNDELLDDCTSADEGDDEMDDELDTCSSLD